MAILVAIGKIAALFGVTPQTIRNWEKQGILKIEKINSPDYVWQGGKNCGNIQRPSCQIWKRNCVPDLKMEKCGNCGFTTGYGKAV